MTAQPMFGKRAADRPNPGGFEYFLKTFREPRTEVTFLWDNPKDDFLEYREHYDHKTTMPGARAAGVSYPCASYEGAAVCIGDNYPVEHPEWTDEFLKTDAGKAMFGEQGAKEARRKADAGWGIRDASGKWVVPVVDDKGFVALYKFGYRFWTHLCGLYQELGSLTNQQFVILKVGSTFNDTAYSALPTGKPSKNVDRDVPTMSDISDLLGKKYVEVHGVYVELGLANEDGTATGASAPDEGSQDPGGLGDEAQAQPRVPLAKDPEPQKSRTPASDSLKEAPPQLPLGLDGLEIPDGWDPFIKAREATPSQLKEWLDNDPRGAHDYPPRAPRGVLTALVEKAQTPFSGAAS